MIVFTAVVDINPQNTLFVQGQKIEVEHDYYNKRITNQIFNEGDSHSTNTNNRWIRRRRSHLITTTTTTTAIRRNLGIKENDGKEKGIKANK